MGLWVIKPGRQGEHEDYFLERDLACLTFPDVPSVSKISSSQEMRLLFMATKPRTPKRSAISYASQTWAFRGLCRVGDSIVLPLKSSPNIAVGRIASEYRYDRGADDPYRHQRDVAWADHLVERKHIDADLRYSFGANKTFCETKRQGAEERIQKLLNSQAAGSEPGATPESHATGEFILDPAEQITWKKLKRFIEQKFDGHDLSCLFAELLTADGYQVQVSPEGHDGGRDILAARGDFGFSGPKICVQVKRTAKPVGAPVFRELLGTMRMFGATHGILVSWSGFTQAAQSEAIEKYFDVRLIDGDELLRMVLSKYSALSPGMKQRLPLRRAWVFKPTDGLPGQAERPRREPS